MALTFPRDMPTGGVAGQKFEPQRVDFLSPEAGGHIGGVSAGFPRWAMTLALGPMGEDDGDAWHAFIPALNGQARTFYAWDLSRPYPKAYPGGFAGMTRGGGGAFPSDGAVSSWSISGDREGLTLGGLPANFALSLRDMIGFRWTTSGAQRRHAVRVSEAAAGSSGGAVTVSITPPLPVLVPPGATVYLERPSVIMRQLVDQTSLSERDANHDTTGAVAALQDLRP